MYIKFIVFYVAVFSLKSVVSDFNVDNNSNVRNTHRIPLSGYHVAQNGQNTNTPLKILGSPNFKQEPTTILHEQHRNVKDPTWRKSDQQLQDSLLPYRQPLDKVLNQHLYLSSKKINVNQHAVTTQRNEKIVDNRFSNYPDKPDVSPFTSLIEEKNKIETSNIYPRSHLLNDNIRSGVVQNENRRIIIPSALQPGSRVPNIDVNKQQINKLIPLKDLKFPINHGIGRQIPATNQQNRFNHQGNVQTNHSSQNKRFTVIHQNGAVEYFNDMKIILKKYPHIRIANNMRHLLPIQNQKAQRPVSIPTVLTSNSLEQYLKLRNEKVPDLGSLNTVNANFLKQMTQNNNQMNNNSQMNKPNSNLSTLHTSTQVQVKMDDKEALKLETLATKNMEISLKPMNNIQIKSTRLQENESKNLTSNIKISKQPETVVTTKVSSISNTNDETPSLENLNPRDKIKQKPSIDVILSNNEKLSHQQNKTTTLEMILSKKHKNSENFTRVSQKDDDLNSNKPAEIISPITHENISNDKPINTAMYENHSDLTEIIKNNSSARHEAVVDEIGKTQSNCTKPDADKHKLKTQNVDLINQTVKEDMDNDYGKDLLSFDKPLMWFSTTDPEFWKKLVSVDDSPNFLYIINVQSQPKIEKDRKTTIHANGTIVEEITETIWDVGDDEPKVTKTIKVTPANAVVLGA